jgi:hypothetical protein
MPIRSVPISLLAAEPSSELMPIAEAAARLGVHEDTLRRWMRLDMEDGKGRVPGGRCEGRYYLIFRAVFDRALREGDEPPARPISKGFDRHTLADILRRIADDLDTE